MLAGVGRGEALQSGDGLEDSRWRQPEDSRGRQPEDSRGCLPRLSPEVADILEASQADWCLQELVTGVVAVTGVAFWRGFERGSNGVRSLGF